MAAPAVNTRTAVNGATMPQESRSDSACSSPTVKELKGCEITSTTESASLLHKSEVRSTYHIYHKKDTHSTISSTIEPSKERCWGPRVKEQKQKRKQRQLEAALKEEQLANGTYVPTVLEDDGSFFLHTPYLSFHDPPRVLYTGSTKLAVPSVLIHSKCLWKRYRLQFGPSIATPGVLDPRGVVSWRHNGGDKKALNADDKKLKGYKVKNWRLWGETGKRYVHGVKAMRKSGTGPDPDVLKDEKAALASAVRADEVVYLDWTSPFSRNTRRYHFRYADIDFYWKGTGTVKEKRKCGAWCRYNHLKLVTQLPALEKDDMGPRPEVCLGKYTSSIAKRKYGTLELYDGAIWRLMTDFMPSALPAVDEEDEEDVVAQVAAVKTTWLYKLIISTAMCMVLGENQKRETIKKIIEALVAEGAGGGAS